jgi:hypothetical protein
VYQPLLVSAVQIHCFYTSFLTRKTVDKQFPIDQSQQLELHNFKLGLAEFLFDFEKNSDLDLDFTAATTISWEASPLLFKFQLFWPGIRTQGFATDPPRMLYCN